MRITAVLLVAVLAFALIVSSTLAAKTKYDEKDVFVSSLKLFTGSKQFFVKGIIYQPQPLGEKTSGGFCSKKINYEGVYYSACYQKDYFDGVNSNNGFEPKPDGPWWQAVWDRDLPLIKQLGANTVRLYHMSSVTQTLIAKYPEFAQKFTEDYAADHKPFMDAAEANGLKVIAPIVAEEVILTQNSIADLKKYAEARIDEIGNHPALLMWVIGNELGLYSKPDLRATVNTMIDYIKSYMLTKWNRVIPVTTTEVDLPESFATLAKELKVDIFSFNAGYRDIYMNTLWLPDESTKFAGWRSVSKSTGKPILVGEFGLHNAADIEKTRPDWSNQQYKTIVTAMGDGCIGGLFDEYSDETMGAETNRGLVSFVAAVDNSTNKDSTEDAVFIPDEVVQKALFSTLSKGISGSAYSKYSFTANEYTLAGTKQATYDLNTNTPSPTPNPNPDSSDPDNRPDDSNASNTLISFTTYVLIAIASFCLLKYVF